MYKLNFIMHKGRSRKEGTQMKNRFTMTLAFLLAIVFIFSSCSGIFPAQKNEPAANASTGIGGTTKTEQTTDSEESTKAIQSAYERAKSLGYGGTLEEFLASIRGADGVGILSLEINGNGELIVSLTDGSSSNLGVVVGKDGKDGADGQDGVGIRSSVINENGELVLVLTDGTVLNLGIVVGTDGQDGANGTGIESASLNENGELILVLTNGTTRNLGVVVGADGQDGQDGHDGSVPYVGENGNWWIGGVDTGERAVGEDGKDLVACEHDYAEWTVVIPASCESIGYSTRVCRKCDQIEYQFHDPIGHDFSHSVVFVEPTCMQQGLTIHYCDLCDETLLITADKVDHAFSEWAVVDNATCEKEGLEEHHCTFCGLRETRAITQKRHEYELVNVETIGEKTYKEYRCTVCGDGFTLFEYDERTYQESELFDCAPDFTFSISSALDAQEIREKLRIVYDYVNDAGSEELLNSTQIPYFLTRISENVWEVSPIESYEEGIAYVAKISGDGIAFCDYYGDNLTFTIASEEKKEIKLKTDIVFLKTLERNAPGYYPYTLRYDEPTETLWLRVGKAEGLSVDDIVCVGPIESIEELFLQTAEEEIYFGKVKDVQPDSSDGYIVLMTTPEMNEVFESLDFYTNYNVDLEEVALSEDIEEEIEELLYASEGFSEFLYAVNETNEEYFSTRSLSVAPLLAASAKDYITLTPKVKTKGTKMTLTIDGAITIPIKDSRGKTLGEIKVHFNLAAEISFDLNVSVKLKKWWFVPVGVQYFDISLKQMDHMHFQFGVEISIDYSLQKDPYVVYTGVNGNSTLHYAACKHLGNVKDLSKLKYITTEELVSYANNEAFHECGSCKPVSALNATAYAVNVTQGTIHNIDCPHLKTITTSTIVIVEKSLDAVRGLYSDCSLCNTCHPESKYNATYETKLLNRIAYTDWKDVINEVTAYADAEKVTRYKSDGVKLFTYTVPLSIFTANLDVRMTLHFDLKASLDYEYETSHTNVFGVRIEGGKTKPYSSTQSSTDKNQFDMIGKAELKLGIKADVFVSLIGLSGLVRAGLTAEVGVYMDVSGVYHNDYLNEHDGYAAAYLEIGVYIEVEAYYKLFTWGNTVNIYNGKFPLLSLGYDRAYYAFAEYVDTIDISDDIRISDRISLDVKYYDLKKMTTATDRLSLNGESKKYSVVTTLQNGQYLEIVNGVLVVSDNAPCYFTDVLSIRVVGVNSDWGAYSKNRYIYYVDEYEIQIVYNKTDGNHTYALTAHKDASHTEQGYDIYTCERCGAIRVETIEAIPHEFGAYALATDPTFSSQGVLEAACACGETVTETLPVLSFAAYRHTVTAPTENDEGAVTYSITEDGQEYTVVVTLLPLLIENGYQLQKGTAPTATESGTLLYYASLGADRLSFAVTIPALDAELYAYAIVSAPSCEAVGAAVYSLTYDGAVFTYDAIIPATGHQYGSFVVAPTCTEEGYTTHVCPNCGEQYTDQRVNALGHNYEWSVTTEATCTEPGVETGVCKHDSAHTTTRTVPALGHDYQTGVCARCGEVKGQYSKGLAFTSNGDGTCYVSGIGTCADPDIVVPPISPEGDIVTKIGEHAFEGNMMIASLDTGDTVTSLEFSSVSGCTNLRRIRFGKAVKRISVYAFNFSGYFDELTVDEENPYFYSVNNCVIERATRSLRLGCQTSIIPDDGSVTSIDAMAFYGRYGLTRLTIPEGVTSINVWVFCYDYGLKTLELPHSLRSIGQETITGCTGLTEIIFHGTEEEWNAIQKGTDWNTYTGNYTLTFLPGAVPSEGLAFTSNGDGTCYVSGIGTCTDTDIVIPSTSPTGNTVTAIDNYAFQFCSFSSITIPNSVTSIGNHAFVNCHDLTSVTIPDSVTSIGLFAFSDCIGLTSVTLPDGITSVEDDLFAYCSNLTSVTIPDSVTSIGDSAFRSCSGLTSVTIPDSVTSIGNYAFEHCSGLTSVTIPDSVTSIGLFAFYDCSGLTSITIPNSVTSIGLFAFYGCTGLTSITIPDSVTSIEEYAFCYCTGLTSVVIPNSVTSIGSYAFYCCSGLTSVTIGSGVTSIGLYAFDGCSGLTSVTFRHKTGWYTTQTQGANSGPRMTVTSAITNATNLKSNYSDYYWYRK